MTQSAYAWDQKYTPTSVSFVFVLKQHFHPPSYSLHALTHNISAWVKSKARDRSAVPQWWLDKYRVGEGFSERSIAAKSIDRSITLKPLGLSKFVLTPSAIKSNLAGQNWKRSNKQSPEERIWYFVWFAQKKKNSVKSNKYKITLNVTKYVCKVLGLLPKWH